MSDLISRQAVLDGIEELKKSPWATDTRGTGFEYLIAESLDTVRDLVVKPIPTAENKGEWIPFSEELPPKGKKVHVSTFGIVTIGERTSEADETLRLSILEPINNLYKNIDPKQYQITHWQPLPKGI